jgi:hypothetical protein
MTGGPENDEISVDAQCFCQAEGLTVCSRDGGGPGPAEDGVDEDDTADGARGGDELHGGREPAEDVGRIDVLDGDAEVLDA